MIICCDNIEVAEVLTYAPQKNIDSQNRDIILIRNLSYDTSMDGRFIYVVLDYALPFMMGYNISEIWLLESGYNPKYAGYDLY